MRIGIDTGGTFTDFVIFDPQNKEISTFKVLSTPSNPAEAILNGLEKIKGKRKQIIHGSTVATNALLERKGAHTALITTKGFRDVLQIARQNRPHLYNLHSLPPEPLVPRELRLEVNERVNAEGEIQTKLNESEIADLIKILQVNEVNSVAVSLLFSFLAPQHEEIIEAQLKEAGFFTSISSKILPVFREYERTSTTCVNAYVSPVLDEYILEFEENLKENDLQIMQSNGGIISPKEARKNAVRCILSGPAGGAVGATEIANLAGYNKIITFDMGGTSTDVALVDSEIQVTTEASIGGFPIRIPIIDIHTVGSGGGSIAEVDLGGSLKVGPESAGADPGPACYGKGLLPTVSDANLVLGRLEADHFLGGEMLLDVTAAQKAFMRLGEELSITSEATALGVVRVVNAHMERALRVISIERGYDPRDFTLVSFGGAGGLHASDLARALNIPTVIIPPQAATLSALGMLMADVVKDYSLTVMLPGNTIREKISEIFTPLLQKGMSEVLNEGIEEENINAESSLDMRYQGQSYELNIPFNGNFIEIFHTTHQEKYGYANLSGEIEIVNLRVKMVGQVEKPKLPKFSIQTKDSSPAKLFDKKVLFPEGKLQTAFFSGEDLLPGNEISGPAIILRSDTTILVPPQDTAQVDEYLNLIISIGEK